MFATLELAQQLERAEGQACREFAQAHQQLDPSAGAAWLEHSGVTAVFDGIDSPVTQTFGLGLFEPLTTEALDTIEAFFHERHAPVTHEVSPLAGIPTLQMLCARQYQPVEVSSVLYRILDENVSAISSPVPPAPTVRIAHPDEAALWARIGAQGWAGSSPEMLSIMENFGALAFAREHTVCFFSEIEGQPGATGSLCLHEGVALLGGASTTPAMRHRGLQSALLQARLRYAYEHGYRLAMMVTEAGSQSQRNAERQHFRIAYTRTKWQLPAR